MFTKYPLLVPRKASQPIPPMHLIWHTSQEMPLPSLTQNVPQQIQMQPVEEIENPPETQSEMSIDISQTAATEEEEEDLNKSMYIILY